MSDRPHLLLTRPLDDSRKLGADLADRGFAVSIEPMLQVEWLDGPVPDLGGVQALLFTSVNGVRAYLHRGGPTNRPVFSVGDATARAAMDAGFQTVESASGDVHALAALVKDRVRTENGTLLHVAADTLAGDLAGMLTGAGYVVRRETMYATVASPALSDSTVWQLRTGLIDAVLFFSPRTAKSFVRLMEQAVLTDCSHRVVALCLSAAVADAACTSSASKEVHWKEVRIATRPDQESLLGLLPRLRGTN